MLAGAMEYIKFQRKQLGTGGVHRSLAKHSKHSHLQKQSNLCKAQPTTQCASTIPFVQ